MSLSFITFCVHSVNSFDFTLHPVRVVEGPRLISEIVTVMMSS